MHTNRGAILLSKEQNTAAKEAFMYAIQIEPSDINAHFNLAVLLTSKLSEHVLAIRHIGIVLKKEPNNHKALHLLSNIMQSIGRKEDSEKYLKMAELAASTSQLLHNDDINNTSKRQDWRNWSKGLTHISQANIGDVIQFDTMDFERTISMECISEHPLLFRVQNFLASTEVASIIQRASQHLDNSFVTGGDNSDSYRTSLNAWLTPDDLLYDIQNRIGNVLGMNESEKTSLRASAEDFQVIKYSQGGQFKVHHDSSSFHPRFMTVLIYLNTLTDIDNGGGTWFPYTDGTSNSFYDDEINNIKNANYKALNYYEKCYENGKQFVIDCKNSHVEFPVEGNAVIIFNHLPTGELDPRAVHAGLPVGINDVKWAANYWFGEIK